MTERFTYSHYLDSVQDADDMKLSLSAFVPFFRDCRRVLDLGCGSGHFLKSLRDSGVEAVGVDVDGAAAQQAEADGLRIIRADVLQFLRDSKESFDGIFCSHLVEHLPFDSLVELIEGIARRLSAGGVLVMAFPNPESLDMQLFHFWSDPQHVRFYHPNLIQTMLRHYEFELDECRFRNWRTGEGWDPAKNSPNGNHSSRRTMIHRMGRRLKKVLGVTRLENEVDYLKRLRSIGEEAVIVARKQAGLVARVN